MAEKNEEENEEESPERTECFKEGMYLESSRQCQACDDREECKLNTEKLSKTAQDAEPTPKKKKTGKKTDTKTKKTTGKSTEKSTGKTPAAVEDITTKTKKAKKPAAPKRPKVKDRAIELLKDEALSGKTYEDLATIIREEIEGTRTNGPCISWYYNKYKGEMDLVSRVKEKKEPKAKKPKKKKKAPVETPVADDGEETGEEETKEDPELAADEAVAEEKDEDDEGENGDEDDE